MTSTLKRPQKLMAYYFGGLLAVVLGGALLHYGWELTPWSRVGQFLATGAAESGTIVAKNFVLLALSLAILWAGHIVRRSSLEEGGPWDTRKALMVDVLGIILTLGFGIAFEWHPEVVLPPEASAIQVLSAFAAINALMWAGMTVVLQRNWLLDEDWFMLACMFCVVWVAVTGVGVASQKAVLIESHTMAEMAWFGARCGALHAVALVAALIGAESYLNAVKTTSEKTAEAQA